MSSARTPASRRWLLCKAVCKLAVASMGLRLVSFKRLQLFFKDKPSLKPEERRYVPHEITDALLRGSSYVPGSTCLVQALAGQWLLQREGYAPVLRIGVSTANGFEAHAWLELEGKVLIGGPDESAPIYAVPTH